MINEEYASNKSGESYTYKYYDKNDEENYIIISNGEIVERSHKDDSLLNIAKMDSGIVNRKREKATIYSEKDWKHISVGTRGSVIIDGKASITNLIGAPQKVGGDFLCASTKVTSLEGAPQKVGGGFLCASPVTSLEGAPKEVGGIFIVTGASITSLKGAPQKIGGFFNCCGTKITREQAIEYLKNNDCKEVVGSFGSIKKSDVIKESYFNY